MNIDEKIKKLQHKPFTEIYEEEKANFEEMVNEKIQDPKLREELKDYFNLTYGLSFCISDVHIQEFKDFEQTFTGALISYKNRFLSYLAIKRDEREEKQNKQF